MGRKLASSLAVSTTNLFHSIQDLFAATTVVAGTKNSLRYGPTVDEQTQGVVPVVERLEVEDMLVSVVVGKHHLVVGQGAVSGSTPEGCELHEPSPSCRLRSQNCP
jgi:hypothetical protein